MEYSLPKGFRAAGISAGIYKNKPEKLDLAFFYSERVARAAGVFTANQVKAAPVLVSQRNIKNGWAQAIIVNSGCANACTGLRGTKDAERTADLTARSFSIKKEDVLVASTGVIGEFLPMEKMEAGLKKISASLHMRWSSQNKSVLSAVHAIMTTDTVPKIAGKVFRLGGKNVTIWGCVKGSGMIHPNMATMLSFIFTDASIPLSQMKKILSSTVDKTFNSLTVDGDTSTNDSLFFLANGLSAELKSKNELDQFQTEFEKVCRSLSLQMVLDGEGATKAAEILVKGARTAREAKKIAETVATSPLVKTALFGEDANWGRVLAASGRAGVPFDPSKVDLYFGSLCVARSGFKASFSEKKAKEILVKKIVPITIHLHAGKSEWRYLTCDFSLDYVKINADYRS